MWRNAKRTANLDHLILPRLEELGRLVAAAEFVSLYAIGQHRRAVCSIRPTVHPLPLLTQTLGCLGRNRVVTLQHDARPGTVAEVCGPVGLQRLGQPDGVLEDLVRRDRLDAVFGRKPQGEDLLLAVDRLPAARLAVAIPQRAVFQPLSFHPRRVQRPQFRHGTASTWADLGVARTVVEVHARHPIPKLLGRLPRVGLHVQQAIHGVARGLLLAAIGEPLKDVERQGRDGVRDHPNAGRVGRARHRVVGVDANARRRTARRNLGPVDATQVEHLVVSDGVFVHRVMMSQFCSAGFAVATACSPRPITIETMPSMRSVLFALLGLMLPWWSVCTATLPAIHDSTG